MIIYPKKLVATLMAKICQLDRRPDHPHILKARIMVNAFPGKYLSVVCLRILMKVRKIQKRALCGDTAITGRKQNNDKGASYRFKQNNGRQ